MDWFGKKEKDWFASKVTIRIGLDEISYKNWFGRKKKDWFPELREGLGLSKDQDWFGSKGQDSLWNKEGLVSEQREGLKLK